MPYDEALVLSDRDIPHLRYLTKVGGAELRARGGFNSKFR